MDDPGPSEFALERRLKALKESSAEVGGASQPVPSEKALLSRFEALAGIPAAASWGPVRVKEVPASPPLSEDEQALTLLQRVMEDTRIESRRADSEQDMSEAFLVASTFVSGGASTAVLTPDESDDLLERFTRLKLASATPSMRASPVLDPVELLLAQMHHEVQCEREEETEEAVVIRSAAADRRIRLAGERGGCSRVIVHGPQQQLFKKKQRTILIQVSDDDADDDESTDLSEDDNDAAFSLLDSDDE